MPNVYGNGSAAVQQLSASSAAAWMQRYAVVLEDAAAGTTPVPSDFSVVDLEVVVKKTESPKASEVTRDLAPWIAGVVGVIGLGVALFCLNARCRNRSKEAFQKLRKLATTSNDEPAPSVTGANFRKLL